MRQCEVYLYGIKAGLLTENDKRELEKIQLKNNHKNKVHYRNYLTNSSFINFITKRAYDSV